MVNNAEQTNPILDKIMKLLAKAEGTKNPHEAEAFTAKAIDLMTKWSVDEAMLAAHRGVVNRNEVISVVIPVRGVYFKAHMDMLNQLGIAFGFRRVSTGKTWQDKTIKDRMVWVGFENDLAAAQLLYTSLLVQLEVALRAFVKENDRQFSYASASEKYQMRRSFMIGFNDVVGKRIRESRKTATDTTPGAGLVLASRSQEIDDKVADLFPNLRVGRGREIRLNATGYSGGKIAGANANLGGTSVSQGARAALGR